MMKVDPEKRQRFQLVVHRFLFRVWGMSTSVRENWRIKGPKNEKKTFVQ